MLHNMHSKPKSPVQEQMEMLSRVQSEIEGAQTSLIANAGYAQASLTRIGRAAFGVGEDAGVPHSAGSQDEGARPPRRVNLREQLQQFAHQDQNLFRPRGAADVLGEVPGGGEAGEAQRGSGGGGRVGGRARVQGRADVGAGD